MARNHNGNRVPRASLSHRPRGLGLADLFGNLLVAGRRSGWNLPKRLPDTQLKRGATYIEREIETKGRHFDESDHLRDPPAELFITRDDLRPAETVLEIAS